MIDGGLPYFGVMIVPGGCWFMGKFNAKESELAIAIPTRRPVNEPGPGLTVRLDISFRV